MFNSFLVIEHVSWRLGAFWYLVWGRRVADLSETSCTDIGWCEHSKRIMVIVHVNINCAKTSVLVGSWPIA